MAKLKVHAANFKFDEISVLGGCLYIKNKLFQITGERIDANDIVSIEVANEDSVKKVGGALGWGVAGAVLMGPLGAVAGLILGGNKKEVTFVAELSNNRKLMATLPSKDYISLVSKVKIKDDFINGGAIERQNNNEHPAEDSILDPLFEDVICLSSKTKEITDSLLMAEFNISQDRAEILGKQLQAQYLLSEPDKNGVRRFLI
ncbi:hypothetical protein DYB39_14535 [Providencia rettgeri]|uniref:hypothetical protein n=1 Tax=Providencia rettgeri TaxID=587 RepID=UPI000E3B89A2|nr:hypothetical protein [Providencia rettgeri]RFT09543.1 hypothetical protein DYB39_14535 [Providencia rettgeri]